MPEPMYKTLAEKLQVPESFLVEHRDRNAQGLRRAYEGINKGSENSKPEYLVINRALHLATSIVVNSSSESTLLGVQDDIRKDPALHGQDERTIITLSYLYHMLTDPRAVIGPEAADAMQGQLRKIREIFDKEKWPLPPQVMQHLGIEELVEQPH